MPHQEPQSVVDNGTKQADGQQLLEVPLLGLDKDCLLLPHRAVDFQIAKIEKQPRSQFLWLTIYRP